MKHNDPISFYYTLFSQLLRNINRLAGNLTVKERNQEKFLNCRIITFKIFQDIIF